MIWGPVPKTWSGTRNNLGTEEQAAAIRAYERLSQEAEQVIIERVAEVIELIQA